VRINIVRPQLPDLGQFAAEFSDCLSSGMVSNNGQYVQMFERELGKFFDSFLFPIAFCNGEMALYTLLQAWKHKLGYSPHESFKVAVPSLTFSGTVNALVANNLEPVFCDVDRTLTLDVNKLPLRDDSVKIVLAVGVYGNLPDLNTLSFEARENGKLFLLDNAPAFGATYNGMYPNVFCDGEIYSFHATKIFSTMEGGAAIVNDTEIHDLMDRARAFGQYRGTSGNVDLPGLNSKMLEVAALVGMKNLLHVVDRLNRRAGVSVLYNTFFTELKQCGYLNTMAVHPGVDCQYLFYPVILNDDATPFVNHMHDRGITVRRYYTAVHDLHFYKDKYTCGDLTFTDSIKNRIVSLPLHTDMDDAEIDYLFKCVNEYFGVK